MVGGVDSLLVAAGKLVTAVKSVNCKPQSRRTNNRRPGKQAVPELANSSAEIGRSGELGSWGAGELDRKKAKRHRRAPLTHPPLTPRPLRPTRQCRRLGRYTADTALDSRRRDPIVPATEHRGPRGQATGGPAVSEGVDTFETLGR